MRAMSSLCVSEHALAAFEQTRSRSNSSSNTTAAAHTAREYQHVTAKFDGVTIEGGLGAAFCLPALDGVTTQRGVLWVQARQSDSNVQDKRKKELQDITNQRCVSPLGRSLLISMTMSSHTLATVAAPRQ